MKKIVLLLLLAILSIGAYAQSKPTTTNPSVKELLSAATSKDPLGVFSPLAKKNGYRGIETTTSYGVKSSYVKNVANGKRVELTISLLDINTFEYIIATSFTPAVFKSWESQIKALGFYFDGHDTQDAFGGSQQEYWRYTKPGYPPVSISKNSKNKEYMLIIGDTN